MEELRKYGNVPQGYLQPLAAVALTGMLSQFFSAPPAEKQNLAPESMSTIESAAQEAQKDIDAKLSSKDGDDGKETARDALISGMVSVENVIQGAHESVTRMNIKKRKAPEDLQPKERGQEDNEEERGRMKGKSKGTKNSENAEGKGAMKTSSTGKGKGSGKAENQGIENKSSPRSMGSDTVKKVGEHSLHFYGLIDISLCCETARSSIVLCEGLMSREISGRM